MNIMGLPNGDEKDNYDMKIGSICLFGNSLTSAFNLLGVCILAISEDLATLSRENGGPCSDEEDDTDLMNCAAKEIGYWFYLMFFFLSAITPCIMCLLYDGSPTLLGKNR
eukprot:UN00229